MLEPNPNGKNATGFPPLDVAKSASPESATIRDLLRARGGLPR
jgi:hypothetical protein